MPALSDAHPRRGVPRRARSPLAVRARPRLRRRGPRHGATFRTGRRSSACSATATGSPAWWSAARRSRRTTSCWRRTPTRPTLLPELPAGAIVPARGQILVTQPVPPILPHPFGNNFDKEYGRQTPGGQILCGGYRRLDEDEGLGHYEERVSPARAGRHRPLPDDALPAPAGRQASSAPGPGSWASPPTACPLIGRMARPPGLTLAAGFNGGGFSWAAIVGKVDRRLLTGASRASTCARSIRTGSRRRHRLEQSLHRRRALRCRWPNGPGGHVPEIRVLSVGRNSSSPLDRIDPAALRVGKANSCPSPPACASIRQRHLAGACRS